MLNTAILAPTLIFILIIRREPSRRPRTVYSYVDTNPSSWVPKVLALLQPFKDLHPNIRIMGKHLVFLYGTLKTGQYFNEWLLKQGVTFGRSIGTGRTVVKFPLVLVSCFKLPFLLHAEGTGHVSLLSAS